MNHNFIMINSKGELVKKRKNRKPIRRFSFADVKRAFEFGYNSELAKRVKTVNET